MDYEEEAEVNDAHHHNLPMSTIKTRVTAKEDVDINQLFKHIADGEQKYAIEFLKRYKVNDLFFYRALAKSTLAPVYVFTQDKYEQIHIDIADLNIL